MINIFETSNNLNNFAFSNYMEPIYPQADQAIESKLEFALPQFEDYFEQEAKNPIDDMLDIKLGVNRANTIETKSNSQNDLSIPDFDEIDLNEEVTRLLESKPMQGLLEEGICLDEETVAQMQLNKRKRKSKGQIDALIAAFDENPDWDKEEMTRLSMTLGISFSQVYKWHWDQKRKVQKQERKQRRKAAAAKRRALSQ